MKKIYYVLLAFAMASGFPTISNAQKVKEYSVNGVKFNMVEVKGGEAKPRYKVGKFQIGQTEVTQELWEAVMGANPSYSFPVKGNPAKAPNLPVNNVSREDCDVFLEKLNKLTGQKFDLPTQEEWEWAARGANLSKGYEFSGSNNALEVAWTKEDRSQTYHPVGTKKPNELGIYDMNGNVWKWTKHLVSKKTLSDGKSVTKTSAIARGGCCEQDATYYFMTAEFTQSEDFKRDDLGLRLILRK